MSLISDKTNGMMKDVADNSIKDLLACFMNAVAFEADWEEKYEEDNIYEETFTNIDRSEVELDMLHSTEYGYIENDDYTGFVKPYKGNEFSFMALLPKHKTQRFHLRNLKTTDLSKLFAERTGEEVEVTIPEFDYSYGGDITGICKGLGISQVFTEDADFSAMTTAWLMLEKIIHKAHIEVDRRGTKAAAVTKAYAVGGCADFLYHSPKEVKLDRPFICAIMHNETGLPVFTGIVNKL